MTPLNQLNFLAKLEDREYFENLNSKLSDSDFIKGKEEILSVLKAIGLPKMTLAL